MNWDARVLTFDNSSVTMSHALFEYEGRKWVLVDSALFEPVQGVTIINGGRRYLAATTISVTGPDPALYPGDDEKKRRLAATKDLANVLVECGDMVGTTRDLSRHTLPPSALTWQKAWRDHGKGADRLDVSVAFTDTASALCALECDGKPLRGGTICVRLRTFPTDLDSPIRRIPAEGFDTMQVPLPARLARTRSTEVKYQIDRLTYVPPARTPLRGPLPCTPFDPCHVPLPPAWSAQDAEVKAGARDLGPVIDDRMGLPWRGPNFHLWSDEMDHERAIQWTVKQFHVPDDYVLPPIPFLMPKLPDSDFPVYEKPKSVIEADHIDDRKRLAAEEGATEDQLSWGVRNDGEHLSNSDKKQEQGGKGGVRASGSGHQSGIGHGHETNRGPGSWA